MFRAIWIFALTFGGIEPVYADTTSDVSVDEHYRFCIVTHRESHSLERSDEIDAYLTDGARKVFNGLNSYSFFQYNGEGLVPIGVVDSIVKPNKLCLNTNREKMTLVVQEHVVRIIDLGETGLIREPQITPDGLRTDFHAGNIDDLRLNQQFFSSHGSRANFEKIGAPAKITLKLAKNGITTIKAERIPSSRGRRITTKLTPYLLDADEECGVEKRVFIDASRETESGERKLELLNVLKDCEMMELASRADFSPMNNVAPQSKRISKSLDSLWKKLQK